MIAQCSHSTLQSLHNAITPHLHPAAAHHRTLYPLRSPPPNPAHSVITPPRIPSCALAVLPRGKRKPSTVHTSSHRCATSFSALAAAPPMPYRSQFITATDDPLLHPPTRNAAKPPHTLQHRFLSCDHPTAHQPHHRPRSPYPAGKPKTPLSLLPLLRSPARPPASSFTLHHTPLLLTRRVDCSHCPRHPASRTTTPCRLHSSCALSLLPRGKPPNPPPTSSPLLPTNHPTAGGAPVTRLNPPLPCSPSSPFLLRARSSYPAGKPKTRARIQHRAGCLFSLLPRR